MQSSSSARAARNVSVVIDSSAVVRATASHPEASAWIERIHAAEVDAHAPDLLYAEVANALLLQVRAGRVELAAALGLVDVVRRLPIRVISLGELAVPALRVADERGLSVYDACYAVLAEEAHATLITADRRLARVVAESVVLD